jgi:hypothetical protein
MNSMPDWTCLWNRQASAHTSERDGQGGARLRIPTPQMHPLPGDHKPSIHTGPRTEKPLSAPFRLVGLKHSALDQIIPRPG